MGAIDLAVEAPPIFTSVHGALMFAFNFTHGSLKKNALAQAQGGGGSGRGLGGLDGAAQAGMILAEIFTMLELRRRVLEAKFSPQSQPCSCKSACCKGARDTAAWREAIDWLTEYVLREGLTGTISHHRLRRALVVRKFADKPQSFITIADACGVHRVTASQYNKAVVEHLRVVERAAMNEIEGRLKTNGVIVGS